MSERFFETEEYPTRLSYTFSAAHLGVQFGFRCCELTHAAVEDGDDYVIDKKHDYYQ
jgi:hypothetical protein